MGALDARLRLITFGFAPRQRVAHGGEIRFRLRDAFLGDRNGLPKRFQPVLALDHPRVMIGTPIDPQPAAANPFAAARDDRMARGQRFAIAQSLRQGLGRQNTGELRDHRGRPSHLGGQRFGGLRRRGALGLDESHPALGEAFETPGMLVQAIDAHGLEIVSEGGLDSPFPAAIDLERLSNPLPLAQPRAIEPLRRLARVMGQRRFLQSFQ